MITKNILNSYKNSYRYYLPYFILLKDNMIMNKNNSFQMTLKVRFKDLDYLSKEEEQQTLERLNLIYKKIPDGYTMNWDVIRSKSQEYPTKDLKDKPYPTRIIDKMRENSIKGKDFYVTDYYLTFTYYMKEEVTDKLDKFIDKLKNIKQTKKSEMENISSEILKKAKEELKEFEDFVDTTIEIFKDITDSVEILKNDELLGFLSTCVNLTKREKLKAPNPQFVDRSTFILDEYLSASTITNNEVFKMNDEYVKTISILHFPDGVNNRVFDSLESLDFEYRYSMRYIVLNREEALSMLSTFKIYFMAKTKSLFQWVVSSFSNQESNKINYDAINKADESEMAETELRTGNLAYGYYTFTFIIKDKNLENLDKKVQLVMKSIKEKDFNCFEDKYNRFSSLIGSLPGNIDSNIRKYPLNTYVLSALTPKSSIYTGNKYNRHLNDVSLLTTKTDKELFYLNLHNGDIGHTLILGPTGAGKSFLLGMLASNFLKYDWTKTLLDNNEKIIGTKKKNSQVIIFDKDRSSKVLTSTSGGKFYDLGNNEIAFQPLKNISDTQEKEWALEWILMILEQEGIEITFKIREIVYNALNLLSHVGIEERTLSNLNSYIEDPLIRQVLALYTGFNVYGKYFDNKQDNITNNNMITFEMGEVMNKPKVVAPLLDYIFHKIESEKLDGTPTLIVLDECWLFLDNPQMAKKMKDWLKTLRKKNTSLVFATQSLDDVSKSSIFATIIDACQTKIFLPNKNAQSVWYDQYKRFGLTPVEIEEIVNGIAKLDYFIKRTDGSRLFQLNPTRTEIAYVGSSVKNDLNKILDIENEVNRLNVSEEEKIKLINMKWLEYKYLTGLIPDEEIAIYKNILK